MSAGQVLAIIVATLGVVAALIALSMPNFDRLSGYWRTRLATALVGLCCLVGGIWASQYYAPKTKTLVDSSREVLDKGRGTATDLWTQARDAWDRYRGNAPKEKQK